MNEDEEYPTRQIRLYPCDICGRNFQQETLIKHKNICKKASTKSNNRKIFDSGKQRAEGSDVIYSKTRETKKVQILGQKPEQVTAPSSNWREKHNEFIKNVRQARVVTEAIKTGGPVPKFEASAVPSDYVNCSYCGRNFSSAAAERHIPFCEQQSKRQKMNTNSANRKVPLPPQKKYSNDGPYGQDNVPNGSRYNTGGYNSGSNSGSHRGYVSGNDRKPIKYDSNLYYESDGQESGKGRSANMTKKKQEMLRTGRNQSNNELNTLARNRGQKDSPLQRRVGNQPSPSGPNRNTGGYAAQHRQNGSGSNQGLSHPESAGTSKFCHECGSEFPVKWARFCSFCGDRRL